MFSRFILADTEQLHNKIAEMSHRIRQLEDALAIFQSAVSEEPHALLSDELMKIKFGAEALPRSKKMEEDEERTQQTIDAIGTLTLNESGAGAYFGRSAGSEVRVLDSLHGNWHLCSSLTDINGTPSLYFPCMTPLTAFFNRPAKSQGRPAKTKKFANLFQLSWKVSRIYSHSRVNTSPSAIPSNSLNDTFHHTNEHGLLLKFTLITVLSSSDPSNERDSSMKCYPTSITLLINECERE